MRRHFLMGAILMLAGNRFQISPFTAGGAMTLSAKKLSEFCDAFDPDGLFAGRRNLKPIAAPSWPDLTQAASTNSTNISLRNLAGHPHAWGDYEVIFYAYAISKNRL